MTQYERGASKERETIKRLLEQGYSWGQRMAGSHSQIDVLVVSPPDRSLGGDIIAVQVKYSKRSSFGKELEQLRQALPTGWYYVKSELWLYQPGKGLVGTWLA